MFFGGNGVFHFPQWLVKPGLGPEAWRFRRDLGRMKSPILGSSFQWFWAPSQQTEGFMSRSQEGSMRDSWEPEQEGAASCTDKACVLRLSGGFRQEPKV